MIALLAWLGDSRVEIAGEHSRFELRSFGPDLIVWEEGREVSYSRLLVQTIPVVYRIFTTLEAAKRYAEETWKLEEKAWEVKT